MKGGKKERVELGRVERGRESSEQRGEELNCRVERC